MRWCSTKIMYLAEEYFCNSGVRNRSKVIFYSANNNIFQVPRYANTLEQVLERKQIITNYNKNLSGNYRRKERQFLKIRKH